MLRWNLYGQTHSGLHRQFTLEICTACVVCAVYLPPLLCDLFKYGRSSTIFISFEAFNSQFDHWVFIYTFSYVYNQGFDNRFLLHVETIISATTAIHRAVGFASFSWITKYKARLYFTRSCYLAYHILSFK